MLRVQKVRLDPNETMKQVLDDLCDYRRYCWNQGLALWNDMYDTSLVLGDKKLRPSERKVRNELVANKEDWQYQLSARCLQLAISDLGKAWSNFFKKSLPDWGKPKFKSKKTARQGFKTDRAQIVNGKLRLDKPHGVKSWADISFKGANDLKGELKVVSIYRENGKYWASLPFEVKVTKKTKTGQKTAVDVNVGHFDYPEGQVKTLPNNLKALYKRIKHYQRLLARKRVVNGKKATQANNYVKTRAKLQRDYRRVANIQHDIVQKFTTMLVNDYDRIAIEDLAVKQMQMSHVASKGLHRSMFGYFKQ
ncbi:transposase, partial [Ligilactobacillus agilis]